MSQIIHRRQVLQCGVLVAALGLMMGCSRLSTRPAVRRIGFLSGGQAGSPGSQASLEAFRTGLRDLGRVDGHDVVIEARYWGTTPDQADALAAELVRLPVEIIVAFGSRDVHAARQATSSIPIVMMAITDPVGQGLVASLARPGGNVTGQSTGTVELTGKRLEILKELVPGLKRVAVFWEPSNPSHKPQEAAVQATCPALGLEPILLPVNAPDDLASAFQVAANQQVGAALTMSSGVMTQNRAVMASLALQHRLPTMFMDRVFVEAGGLLSYGANLPSLNRTAATFVHKILNGARPADLPVEQPTTVDFIVNQTTAQALGLTLPPSIQQQATEVTP